MIIKQKENAGLTLVEILVAMSIGTMIMLAVFKFGQNLFSFSANSQKTLSAETDARRVLKNMVKELREASPSSLGGYPLSLAGTSSLTFFSNIDSDNYKEQIRYFLAGTELKRGVIKPSGATLSYNPANESLTTMIKDISNGATPIFEYFDSTYAGTSTPLADPVMVSRVRLIKITISIQKAEVDLNKLTAPFIATSQVFLRNLKDNL